MAGARVAELKTGPAQMPSPGGLSRPERLMAIAAAFLAASIVAIVVALANLASGRDAALRDHIEAREARLAVYGLMQATIDAETGQRGYLLTGDRAFLAPYESGRADAARHLARLRRTAAAYPEFNAHVELTQTLAQQAFEQLAAPLERDHSRARLRVALRDSKAAMDALRSEARELLRDLEQRIEASRVRERTTTARLYWLGGALALIAMIAVAVTIWALLRERRAWRKAFSALDAARAAADDARARAHASDLAKTRFLAVASHDMRQPLHALTLYLSALERRIDNPEARDILTKMERATDAMIAMFATLLDLARIQAGAVDPEIAEFPLQEVFDRLAAENPGGKVIVEPTRLRLRSDRVLLERALRNLVANALKHGGGHARLSARALGSRAEVVVADDGPGIAPEDQARVFDEFVRLDTRGEGLGLGLAIVRGIATALNVPLDLQSAPGRGARFILRPELAQSSDGATAAKAEPVAFDGARTLVVDDDRSARDAIAHVLNDRGAQVRAAGNEAEAQSIVEEGFMPRLLVMDLRLDGQLQGIEVARRLRARIDPPPDVVIVTGDTAADTLALLQESGFPWLVKPVSPSALTQLISAQLTRP